MNHGWEKKRLGEICASKKDILRAYNKFNFDDIIEYIDISSIDRDRSSISHTSNYTLKDAPSRAQQVINQGDILLSLVRPNLKNIACISLGSDNLVASSGFCVLRSTGISSRFLFYIVSNDYFTEKLVAKCAGAAYPAVREEDVRSIPISVPPMEIQNQIVAELDKLKELIEIKRNQLKDLDTLAQSLFYETFGDPLENSKQWKVGTLSEYAAFKNGLNFTPTDNGNKIKCLGVGDFKSNRFIKSENLSEINIVESIPEEYLLKDGDIILVRSNGNKALIGRSIMFISDGLATTFSGFCIRCRYNREVLVPMFLSYYLSCGAVREFITSQGRGCNISNLNQKILSGIPLILPPISLQDEFAAKIAAIEGQKRLIESSIADLETLLASRMDYWFNE